MRMPAARHSPASHLPVTRPPAARLLPSRRAARQPRSHLPAARLPLLPLACLLSADAVRNRLSSQMCAAGGQALTIAHPALACRSLGRVPLARLPHARCSPAARLPLTCLSRAKRLPLASCACQARPLSSCSLLAVCKLLAGPLPSAARLPLASRSPVALTALTQVLPSCCRPGVEMRWRRSSRNRLRQLRLRP